MYGFKLVLSGAAFARLGWIERDVADGRRSGHADIAHRLHEPHADKLDQFRQDPVMADGALRIDT